MKHIREKCENIGRENHKRKCLVGRKVWTPTKSTILILSVFFFAHFFAAVLNTFPMIHMKLLKFIQSRKTIKWP